MTPGSGGGPAERAKAAILEDVASLAGVSAMTVSRVLNTPEKVRPETRTRVLAAIRELGYRPNFAARSLATGRSGVLGVVSFDTTLYGPASTLYAIESAAREHDYLVNIASLKAMTRRSIAEGVDRLRQQSVDGIIIIAPHESGAVSLQDLPPDLPVVDVGGGDRLPVPAIAVDHQAGAMRATRHLLNLGHETVHHLSGPANWIDANGRIAGWRKALGDHAAPEPLAGDWTANSGYEQGKRLARDPSVTAVFVANDPMALGLMRALREAGRPVPEDVSVVGYDDVPEAAYFWPPLTTVRQNFETLGRQAFQLLLDQMEGAESAERRTVEPELVVRESTDRR
ncbi:LacI family DNA-binding transcriptional regulator [Herbidospora sp. RD11066]